MTTIEKLEWALMTLRDKLTFGMNESEAVYRRESRCKGVLVDAIKEVEALEEKLKVAVEALELITKIAYYLDYKDHRMFARETLEKIKGI